MGKKQNKRGESWLGVMVKGYGYGTRVRIRVRGFGWVRVKAY